MNEKIETNYLYWINPQNKKRYSAGVAFYEEEYSEYRLKVDCYPEKKFYLRIIGIKDDQGKIDQISIKCIVDKKSFVQHALLIASLFENCNCLIVRI